MEVVEGDEFFELKIGYAYQVLSRLEFIENIILEIEKESDLSEIKTYVRQLMAEFHSIKGNASALRFDAIKIICHKVEDLVISEGESSLKSKVEILLNYVDTIKDYFTIFSVDRSIDDNVFVIKHREIYENINLIKKKQKEVNSNKILINALIVGVSKTIIKNIQRALPNIEFNFSFANNSVNALERISKEKFDLIFSSYFLEPLNGISLSMAIKCQWPQSNMKIILMPSQEIELKNIELESQFLPDKIYVKDGNLYNNVSKYIKSLYFKEKVVNRLICFDDEENILNLYRMAFEELKNVEIRYILKEIDFIKQVEEFKPELVISDVQLPNLSAMGILKKYINVSEFIFITGDSESTLAQNLLKEGAVAVWDKSEIVADLLAHLRKLEYEIS